MSQTIKQKAAATPWDTVPWRASSPPPPPTGGYFGTLGTIHEVQAMLPHPTGLLPWPSHPSRIALPRNVPKQHDSSSSSTLDTGHTHAALSRAKTVLSLAETRHVSVDKKLSLSWTAALFLFFLSLVVSRHSFPKSLKNCSWTVHLCGLESNSLILPSQSRALAVLSHRDTSLSSHRPVHDRPAPGETTWAQGLDRILVITTSSPVFSFLGSPFFSYYILSTSPRAGRLPKDSQTPSAPGLCFAFMSGLEAIRNRIHHPKLQATMQYVSMR